MHGHGHGHGQLAPGRAGHRRRLLIALGITGGVLIAQVVGAVLSGSLALFADAGHMVTDLAGLALAAGAITLAGLPPDPRRTFGYHRLEILAALLNGMLLFAVALVIVVEAIRRWGEPPPVDGPVMLTFAAVGLLANLASLLVLRDSAAESLNVRGAYTEVLGDLWGSLAVIAAAAVIWSTGWLLADPIASLVVAALIVPRTWALLRDAVDVLLEATPKGVDLDEVRAHILEVDGVIGAHDLHAWTITSGMPVLSAHVVLTDEALQDGGGRVLDALGACLGEHFDVAHCTFQLEAVGHAEHEPAPHA